MGYIIPNAAERAMLDYALSASWYVGLFVNNYTPVAGTVMGNLTECSDGQYSGTGRQYLSFGGASTSSGKAVKSAPSALSWSFTPDELRTPFTVYGYFVTDDSSYGSGGGTVYAVERFSSPFVIDVGTTQTISVGGPFKMSLRDANS